MNLIDVVFFVKLCESDFEKARSSLSITRTEAIDMLSSIQSFVGFPLFTDSKNPSVKMLTEKGKSLLPSAKRMIADLLSNSFDNSEESNENIVKVKADILGGKNIVLPSINELEKSSGSNDVDVEMFTYEDHGRIKTLDMHVLFHKMERSDNLFFDRHWSVKVNQGLYASNEYLQESGNIPEKPEDLLQHAILGLGDTFDRDIYSYTNWHLSGKYLNVQLNPALMINSRSVLVAAISAHLGIGPLIEYKSILENKELCRILPDIKGPPVLIDFAIRKNLSKKLQRQVDLMERRILERINKMGLEVVY